MVSSYDTGHDENRPMVDELHQNVLERPNAAGSENEGEDPQQDVTYVQIHKGQVDVEFQVARQNDGER